MINPVYCAPRMSSKPPTFNVHSPTLDLPNLKDFGNLSATILRIDQLLAVEYSWLRLSPRYSKS